MVVMNLCQSVLRVPCFIGHTDRIVRVLELIRLSSLLPLLGEVYEHEQEFDYGLLHFT
jgi:hypothetical protein